MTTKFYLFEVPRAAMVEAEGRWSDVPLPRTLEAMLEEPGATVTSHSLAIDSRNRAFISITVTST